MIFAVLPLLAAGAAPASAPVAAAAPVFTVTVSGETGSLLELSAEPGLAPKRWEAFRDETRRDGERMIRFRLVFEERWSDREGGGRRAVRGLREAAVTRVVSGGEDPPPLPGDYQTASETLDFDAEGRLLARKFTGDRLPEPEIEMISQFLALEPFPAPPPGFACGAEFTREGGAPWYRIRDAYAAAAPEKNRPCDPARLALARDITVAADSGAGAPELRTATPARFAVTTRCDGLPAAVEGGFEFSFSETLDAPREMRAEKPAPPARQRGSAPAPAPGAAPKLTVRYRLPTIFRVARVATGEDRCR